jgi:PPM family protein phosphatase
MPEPESNSLLLPSATGAERFNVGFATDIGLRRTQNQDSLGVHPDLGLFIVADGMGGHQGGETASQMAVEIIPESVRTSQQNLNWDAHDTITRAICAGNDAIFERALRVPMLRGMGTTVTSILFRDDRVIIGHVGDSRCYLFRRVPPTPEGTPTLPIWQATRDHSLVHEKLRAGLITRAEMRTHRMKNVITRSVGFEKEISVETYEIKTQPGDVLLLCSDGLSGLIQDVDMQGIVEQHLALERNIQLTVQKLIQTANLNGGDDNITAVMVEVLEGPKAL